jgi:thiol oxidase
VRALTMATLDAWATTRGDGDARGDDDAAVVEFYMPWCGHCQHFAPEFAKAATAIKAGVAAYAVDCTTEGMLCKTFGATSYPTVLLGAADAFARRDVDKLKKFTRARHVAADVVQWVDAELGTTYATRGAGANAVREARRSDEARLIAREGQRDAASGDGSKVTWTKFANAADLERATIEMYAQMLSEAVFVSTPETREAFASFLALESETHPIETCHRGLTNVLTTLDETWPKDGRSATGVIRAALTVGVRVCGKPRGEDVAVVPRWVECAGSVDGLRGYTCGVWTLLHAMAARVPGSSITNAEFIRAVEGWVRHFFPCEECRTHFLSLIENPETGFGDYIDRADGASMWLWKAHNIVNARLAAEDAKAVPNDATLRTGSVLRKSDPAHPKVQFPPKSLCPSCYERTAGGEDSWDEVHVSEFLTSYYLAAGERLQPDLKAATKRAEFLASVVDASSMRVDASSRLRKALNSGDDIMTVYDVFWMSARAFVMFAFVLFMALKSGTLSLSRKRGHGKFANNTSPRLAAHARAVKYA